MKLIYIIFRNSVPTSQKVHCVSTITISWLTLFRVIIAIYYANRATDSVYDMTAVKNELERMWNAAAMAYVKLLSRYLSGGTEESQENLQSEESVSRPRFEFVASGMDVRIVTT
jgi:hypothetical protein